MQAVEFHPLTTDRWGDFEKLFGENGACAGCWCMWWRLRRSEWERRKGQSNKRAFKRLAASGRPLGVPAYADNEPVGWCAVGLRETLGALDRSRVLAPVPLPKNATPVWSISCFFYRPFIQAKGTIHKTFEIGSRVRPFPGGDRRRRLSHRPEGEKLSRCLCLYGSSRRLQESGLSGSGASLPDPAHRPLPHPPGKTRP